MHPAAIKPTHNAPKLPAATLHSLSSPLSLRMMRLACDCDANHKAAAMMDGLRDRLRLLVGGAFTNTYFLFDPCDPLTAFIQPPVQPSTPTSCLRPLIIVPPLLAMCWESKDPPCRSSEWNPPSPALHTINPLVDRDGLESPMTPCLPRWTPYPGKGWLSLMYNRGDARKSEQVKSAAPGRKSSQCSIGEFFSL